MGPDLTPPDPTDQVDAPRPAGDPAYWNSPPERPCSWCGASIPILRKPGRPRLYCRHACRQRAYEHRHGFRHQRSVLPLPGQRHGNGWRGSGYEQGGAPVLGLKYHAMRTSVRPDGRRRETLCGLLVAPALGHYFAPGHDDSCRTCARVVDRNPLTYGISPSNELSRLRALITEGVEQRLDPAALLEYLRRAARPERPRPTRRTAPSTRAW